MEGQQTYRAFFTGYTGEALDAQIRKYGLDPATIMPPGFALSDLGKCEHAIRDPHSEDGYEIGVIRRRDGNPGWRLLLDDFGEMAKRVGGAGCDRLKQAYATSAARRAAMQQGFQVREVTRADGSIQLVCRK